jgi:hypothetical protein
MLVTRRIGRQRDFLSILLSNFAPRTDLGTWRDHQCCREGFPADLHCLEYTPASAVSIEACLGVHTCGDDRREEVPVASSKELADFQSALLPWFATDENIKRDPCFLAKCSNYRHSIGFRRVFV